MRHLEEKNKIKNIESRYIMLYNALMDKLIEKKVSSKEIFAGRLIKMRVDTVKLPNGKTTTREVVAHPGAVAIIAITEDKELVLVRQFRHPTGQILLEIPAGVPKKGETAEATAKRELNEETGFQAKKVSQIWQGYVSPGYSDECIKYCLAEDLIQVQPQCDEDEFVEVDVVDLETCQDLVKTGKIKDNKTALGIIFATQYLNGEL